MMSSILARLCRGLFAAIVALGITQHSAVAESITVTHWGAAFYGAPYAVAMEKGWFKTDNFNVTGIITSTGGGTSVRNTLASDTPFGEVALPAAIEAIRAGSKLKIIFSGVNSVFDQLWATRPGQPFKSIKDLKGKKLGYTRPASVTNMLILMALEDNGMKPSDVELIPVGSTGANFTAILQGSVDAATVSEPIWSREKSKLQPVFWVKDVMSPHMTQTVGITTEDYAAKRPDVLKAIVEGRRKGVQFIYENPDDAAVIVAKLHNWDPELIKSVFREFVKNRYWDEGKFDYKGLNAMVRGLRIVGQLEGEVDWGQLIDQRFLPADLRTTN
ncbi:MAG TPA: ABC transporter substrate-binding protein [Hyphomicrobiaceae bacterium]|nr:ABC transporter substrate-binding protein [Hyphomicrobiaceae bacterium]